MAQLYDSEAGNFTITLGGDTMLTRQLSIYSEKRFLGLAKLFRDSDVGFVNLEGCARYQDEGLPGITRGFVLELAEEVTFLNKGAIIKELKAIPDGSRVTIDSSRSLLIDQDVLEIIEDFETSAKNRQITVRRIGNFHDAAEGRRLERRSLTQAASR